MTSDNDPLSDIFSQMAAEEMVDPAVFDQRLEAAFDHDGSGFDELLPDNDDSSTEGDPAVGVDGGDVDSHDDVFETDDTDPDGDATDFSIGPDLTDDYSTDDDLAI